MSAQHSTPEARPTARRSSRFRRNFLESGVLISAALWLLLPGATQASEDSPAESNAKAGERPAWLRSLGDEADSTSKPSAESGEEAGGNYRAGWSELEPGVLDIQAWDWLQMDLDRMLDLTTAPPPHHLSPEAFEAKYVDATVEFLQIDAEETEAFQIAVTKALDEIEGSRAEMLRRNTTSEPGRDDAAATIASRASWEAYSAAQHRAVRHPIAVLEARPRHQLLVDTMLKWILRLKYGIGAAGQ